MKKNTVIYYCNVDIYKINETSVNKFVSEKVVNIEDVIELDQRVREFAHSLLSSINFYLYHNRLPEP